MTQQPIGFISETTIRKRMIGVKDKSVFSESEINYMMRISYNDWKDKKLAEDVKSLIYSKSNQVFTKTGKGTVETGLDSRKKAMEWWNSLLDLCTTPDNYYIITKENLMVKYYGEDRGKWTLTGREIEGIYKAEEPDTHLCNNCGKIKDGNSVTSFCFHCRNFGIMNPTCPQEEPKLYTKNDVMNALHHAELKHQKDYSKIWELMHQHLNNTAIKR